MRLVRRASLKAPGWSITDGPPVACPSGIVVGGETVANYDRDTLRPIWRIRGCFGHVVVGEHDLEDPSIAVDAIQANAHVRIPRLAVGIDSRTGQSIWRRKVAFGPWAVGDELVALSWERNEIHLLEPSTGEQRRSLREVVRDECPMAAPIGRWAQLLFFSGASHRRLEDPVCAVNLESGDIVWRRSLVAVTRELTGASRNLGAIGVSADHIIFTAADDVVAFSCDTGQHVWTQRLPDMHWASEVTPKLVLVAGPRPPGVAWIDAATGALGHPSDKPGLRGESFEVHGTFRGQLVCSSTAEYVWLVDTHRGNVSRHRIPRTEIGVAVECHQLLCLADEGRRVLILEARDEAA